MINYSNGQKYSKTSHKISHKNRGLGFEDLINKTNEFYKNNSLALVYKKPTPIKILKTGRKENSFKILDACFESPSTTDYNGVYRGRYIDFEAKETLSTTSFPFSNIHDNQIKHIFRVLEHYGIVFLLISFKSHNEVYLLKGETLKMYIERGKNSIKYEDIKKEGFFVPSSYLKPVDYLAVLEKFLL